MDTPRPTNPPDELVRLMYEAQRKVTSHGPRMLSPHTAAAIAWAWLGERLAAAERPDLDDLVAVSDDEGRYIDIHDAEAAVAAAEREGAEKERARCIEIVMENWWGARLTDVTAALRSVSPLPETETPPGVIRDGFDWFPAP